MVCFTDGSSSRKFNSIGSSYVIFSSYEEDIPILEESFGFFGYGYSDCPELMALLLLLEDLLNKEKNNEVIDVYIDSQYVANEFGGKLWFLKQLTCEFIGTKNVDLLIYILHLRSKFSNLYIHWTKGHREESESFDERENFIIRGNNLADKLATEAHLIKDSNRKSVSYPKDISELLDFNEFRVDVSSLNEERKSLKYIKQYYLNEGK